MICFLCFAHSESAPWDMKLVLFFEDVLEHVLGVGHVYANVDLEATSLDSNNVLAVISKLSDGDALVTIRISQRATCEGDDALFDLNVVGKIFDHKQVDILVI